jgi:arylsulfatase A-like enzyme
MSLAPLLRGEAPATWRDAIYYRYYEYPEPHRVEPHYGLRSATHKLVHFPRLGSTELYDLRTDPHELHNLAADPLHAELAARLDAQLLQLAAQFGDRF